MTLFSLETLALPARISKASVSFLFNIYRPFTFCFPASLRRKVPASTHEYIAFKFLDEVESETFSELGKLSVCFDIVLKDTGKTMCSPCLGLVVKRSELMTSQFRSNRNL